MKTTNWINTKGTNQLHFHSNYAKLIISHYLQSLSVVFFVFRLALCLKGRKHEQQRYIYIHTNILLDKNNKIKVVK